MDADWGMVDMMGESLLVGSTGFVGGNLLVQHEFSRAVHASDVTVAYGMRPSLCIYAGVPSAMFLANADPEADFALMTAARANLRAIGPMRVVLVSTIAVYSDSRGKHEESEAGGEGASAYGLNRLQLEEWVREDFDEALVVRLPALYGEGLKKNFVRDLISVAPALLTSERYEELSGESSLVFSSYDSRGDGYFVMRADADVIALRKWFSGQDFNALSFTDSRSRFQFYGLGRLWSDICTGLEGGYETFNLATPPVSAAEVYRFVRGTTWENKLDRIPFDYDMRTLHAPGGYLCSLGEELEGLRSFVEEHS